MAVVTMFRIKAQNKAYTGVRVGVAFKAGVGETADPAQLEWFRRHGYTVREVEVEVPDPEPEPEPSESAIEEPAVEAETPAPKVRTRKPA